MSRLLHGTLTISRLHDSHGDDMMQISLVDRTSQTQCVEIRTTMQALMEALTSEAERPCTFEWRPEHVGKRAEHKIETVPFAGKYARGSMMSQTEKIRALAPFEINGWRGEKSDLGNMHRGGTRDGYRVRFTRYVDIE